MSLVAISGAGSGIGKACAEKFAEQGWRVVLIGRQERALQKALEGLHRPGEHIILAADIRNKAALHSKIKQVEYRLGDLCGVVANAGVGGTNQYGEEDRWDDIISTNLTGSYLLVQELLPYLRKNTNAKFKNVAIVASILARLGVPGYSAYCASKAGLLGLMRSLSVELAPENILVNAICPGWVNTEMARQGIQDFAKATGKTYDEALREQMRPVPLGKMSEPAEVASLIYFLMSGEQSSFTGQTLDLNNGALMP